MECKKSLKINKIGSKKLSFILLYYIEVVTYLNKILLGSYIKNTTTHTLRQTAQFIIKNINDVAKH